MTEICIVDFGAGNVYSVKKALQRLGANAVVSGAAADIRRADGIVLPGDGNFAAAMTALQPLEDELRQAIGSKPFLGICVGTQALFEGSDESPGVKGLGIFEGTLTRFCAGAVCPHMGWNRLRGMRGALFEGIGEGAWAYFIHSYKADGAAGASAECDYGGRFVAAVQRGSVCATQFHPEKSGETGRAILGNFVRLCKR